MCQIQSEIMNMKLPKIGKCEELYEKFMLKVQELGNTGRKMNSK